MDALVEAALLQNGETLTGTNLFLPAHEQFVLDQQGGEITAQGGRIKVEFPKDALPENATIDIGAPSGDEIPAYSLLGEPFEINAVGEQSKQKLDQFSKELTISVSYADLGIPEELENDLHLYWYNSELQEWSGLATYVDRATKTLHAFTDHFTVFDINVNNWQAGRFQRDDQHGAMVHGGRLARFDQQHTQYPGEQWDSQLGQLFRRRDGYDLPALDRCTFRWKLRIKRTHR